MSGFASDSIIRFQSTEDIPTAKEAGYPSLTLDGLVGLFGSKKMSPEVRDKIAADMIEAASDPEVVKKLTPMGQVVRPGPAAEFASEIDAQRKVIAESAKRAAGK